MIIIGIVVIILLWLIYKKVRDVDEYNQRQPLTRESAEEARRLLNQSVQMDALKDLYGNDEEKSD